MRWLLVISMEPSEYPLRAKTKDKEGFFAQNRRAECRYPLFSATCKATSTPALKSSADSVTRILRVTTQRHLLRQKRRDHGAATPVGRKSGSTRLVPGSDSRFPDGKNVLERLMRPRDDVHGDQLAHAPGGSG